MTCQSLEHVFYSSVTISSVKWAVAMIYQMNHAYIICCNAAAAYQMQHFSQKLFSADNIGGLNGNTGSR